MWGKMLKVVLPPVVTLVLAVILWQAAVKLFHIPAYELPAPSALRYAVREQARPLLDGLLITAISACLGFTLSAVVGVVVAIILSSSRTLERAFYPFTVFLQTVPLIAIAPLLSIWIGYGTEAVVVAAFIVSVFPVIANTLTGLRSVDPALLDMFRLYGSSPFARLFKLKLPSAMPQIFTGLRIAAGLAVIGTIVGELVTGSAGDDAGLGLRIMTYIRESRTDCVFAAVGLASLLGLAMFVVVSVAGHLALRRWHASEQER